MDKTPFSVYDFFAYLSSGAVLIATADYVWRGGLITRDKIGPVFAVALISRTFWVISLRIFLPGCWSMASRSDS
jgi:hypothetical protein